MFDHLTEMMLKSYFVAENTVGRFSDDKETLFFAYADIFLLPREEAERLFALSQSEEVRGIRSESEYHRYLRLKQFLSMDPRAEVPTSETDEIVELKGTAFTVALTFRLMHDAKDVRAVACEDLTFAAESGDVLGLNTLGILQSEGIVFGKDPVGGREKIRNAADWNNEEGLFAALRYDPERRERYLERLQGCLVRIGHADVFKRVEAVYGAPKERRREYLLLEKAFRQGIIKRDVYNKSYARLVYSEILGERAKEALVLTPNKELFAEACTLPLKLGHGGADVLFDALEGARPDHPEEAEKVACGLGNTDLRAVSAYRPLCFVSDSRYMLGYYAELVSKCFASPHVERIEIGDLADYDLEPTKNHIFVRSCDEDAFNVYLLMFRGEIGERAFDTAKNFLQSGKRGKFHLNHPSVELDLSAVLPVCFCDRENAKKLKPYCDVIRIADLTPGEKRLAMERVIREKKETYGVREIALQEGLAERLCAYGIDAIDRAIDAAVRERRGKELLLTECMLMSYLANNDAKHKAYGFGGSIHDNRE